MNAPDAIEDQVARLGPIERAIVQKLIERLLNGQQAYGLWDVHDGRRYLREALEEFIDAAAYGAAEILRLEKRCPIPR